MVTNIFTTYGSTVSTSETTSMSLHKYNLKRHQYISTTSTCPGSSPYLTLSPSDYKLPIVLQHFDNLKTRAARDKEKNLTR